MNGDEAPSTREDAFSVLTKLFGDDRARVTRVLRAFNGAAEDDLLLLDGAVRAGDGAMVRSIAHRLAMACHLVGEAHTGRQLEIVADTIAGAAIDPVLTQRISRARTALIESISRISELVDESATGPKTSP